MCSVSELCANLQLSITVQIEWLSLFVPRRCFIRIVEPLKLCPTLNWGVYDYHVLPSWRGWIGREAKWKWRVTPSRIAEEGGSNP